MWFTPANGVLAKQVVCNKLNLVFCHCLDYMGYCRTLNVSVPFILRAKQNREIKGREYQLQASISNYMILICQNKRGQNNFAC